MTASNPNPADSAEQYLWPAASNASLRDAAAQPANGELMHAFIHSFPAVQAEELKTHCSHHHMYIFGFLK